MTASGRPTADLEKEEAKRQEAIRDKAKETEDLNDALEDSFPASDPPSMTQPKSKTGAPAGRKTEAPRR